MFSSGGIVLDVVLSGFSVDGGQVMIRHRLLPQLLSTSAENKDNNWPIFTC